MLGADLAVAVSADRTAEFRAAQAAPEEVRAAVTAEVLAMDVGHLGELVGIDLFDAEDFVAGVVAEQDIEATYRLVPRVLCMARCPTTCRPCGSRPAARDGPTTRRESAAGQRMHNSQTARPRELQAEPSSDFARLVLRPLGRGDRQGCLSNPARSAWLPSDI